MSRSLATCSFCSAICCLMLSDYHLRRCCSMRMRVSSSAPCHGLPDIVFREKRVEAGGDVGIALRLVVVRASRRDDPLLVQSRRLEIRLQRHERPFGAVELLLGAQRLELHIRIRELDQHRAWRPPWRRGARAHARRAPPSPSTRIESAPAGACRDRVPGAASRRGAPCRSRAIHARRSVGRPRAC